MEVQYIILLCLIVVRQTSGKKNYVDKMADDVEVKCKRYSSKSTCKDLSNSFETETRGGSDCSNSISVYSKTVNEIPPTSRKSTVLLWSGCGMKDRYKAIQNSNSTYITVATTYMGLSFYGLHWMKRGEDDINYINNGNDDPIYGGSTSCPTPFEYIFWAKLSQQFAYQARGVVQVILSAKSRVGAYDKKSYFGMYEVPSLHPSTTLRVYLYDAKDKKTNCKKEDTIKKLKEEVEKRGVTFECTSEKQPPGAPKLSSYVESYDDEECGGCVMKLSTHILVVVFCVHIFN